MTPPVTGPETGGETESLLSDETPVTRVTTGASTSKKS